MGILDKLLTAQTPAGVSSVNAIHDAVMVVASPPLNVAPAGQNLSLTFVVANQARGDIFVRGPASWGRKAAGAMGTVLTANGPGGDLTYAPLDTAVGGVLAHTYDGTRHLFTFEIASQADGDILTRIAGAWTRYGAGEPGAFLRSGGPGQPVAWTSGNVDFGSKSILFGNDAAGIRYGGNYVLYNNGFTVSLGNNAILGANVMASSSVALSANAGFQLVVSPGKVTLFDSSLGAGGGVGVVAWKNSVTPPSAGVANAFLGYATGGAFKALTAANIVEHMVSAWGSPTVTSRFCANVNMGTTTTQLSVRTLTINGTTVNVLIP